MNMHKNAKLTPAGREELVRRVLEEGHPADVVGRDMGVSRRTVFKWIRRFRREGRAGLYDRSSRPERTPKRLGQEAVRQIERLRKRRLTGLEISTLLKLAVSTVSLWLRRLGLGRLRDLEPKPVVVRYERKRPGELLHLDTKKLGKIHGVGHRITGNRRGKRHRLGWEYLHVCIDDATRLVYAEVLPDEKGETAAAFLKRALAWFRSLDVMVERVMTDNGSCYRSGVFNRVLDEQGIRHLYTRPYRPQTNGKAERFMRTAKNEWAYRRAYKTSAARTTMLPAFITRYNTQRRHRGIGNITPQARLEALV